MSLTLRPMTREEFGPWREVFVREWGEDLAQADQLTLAEATARATERTDASLPEGPGTKGHHLFVLLDGELRVGTLWFSIDSDRRAFLDDLTIAAPLRRRGYGRQAMGLLEAEAGARGCTHVCLNVYRHNPGAIALYEQLGYRTSRLQMAKPLTR